VPFCGQLAQLVKPTHQSVTGSSVDVRDGGGRESRFDRSSQERTIKLGFITKFTKLQAEEL
jgi:hypothetical protein